MQENENILKIYIRIIKNYKIFTKLRIILNYNYNKYIN